MLNRIYALMSIVLVVALAVTGLAAIQVISNYHDQRSQSQLLAAARLIQYRLHDGDQPSAAGQRALKIFDDDAADMRLTIINRQGTVLYDNKAEADEMGNHLYRPEIAHAFNSNETGTAIRRSSTVNEEMLYLAIFDPVGDLVIRTALPVYEHRAGISEIILTIVLVMAASLIVLLLAGIFSARLITRPLFKLKDAVTAVSDGQYSARVPSMGPDDGEVASLSQSFNQMAEKLEDTVYELEDKNARLDAMLNAITGPLLAVDQELAIRFINQPAQALFGCELDPDRSVFPLLLVTRNTDTELMVRNALDLQHHQSRELPLQTEQGEQLFMITASPFHSTHSDGAILSFQNVSQARQLQKMRSEFVANVTHELRTPLTSIRGFIETLREGAIHNPDVADRFLEIIDIEADRLYRLISDILSLSEIEDLAADTDMESFDLNALIEDVAVLLDESATNKKVHIRLDDTEVLLPVKANRHRIKQILINLADNAIKYNRLNGTVDISARRSDENTIEIRVADNGYGIPQEHTERIFERFYRVDKGRSREMGGTGLGLSIVKHIAQLYAGNVSVKSQLGIGSEFIVSLKI